MNKIKTLIAVMILMGAVSCGQPAESTMSKLNANSGSLATKRDQMNMAADTVAQGETSSVSTDTTRIK